MDDQRDTPGSAEATDVAPAGDAVPPSGAGADPSSDPLVAVRGALEDVLDLPLPARAEVFEGAHRVVVAELRALELG